MRNEKSSDTAPELEPHSLRRLAALRAGEGGSLLGVRFVFPTLLGGPLHPSREEPLVLGREGQGAARLPGSEISRHHAHLALCEGRLHIRDLGSRNGVFVNGKPCSEAPLAMHDVIRMGEWVGVVVALDQEGDPTASAPATDPAYLHLGPMARQLAQRAARVAATNIAVVLEGETGTGKERFARAIHEWSGRRGPLVAINCAAVPEALAEAELFGHREGAFTGASRSNPGHFRAAHEGTLFLDEVADMPLPVQAKLLRALEQKAVLPVGDSRPVPVDVRIIAATQVPLERAVAQKRLRADLHARLDGFTLQLPPLRERRIDTPSLLLHLLGRHGLPQARLTPRLVEAICVYEWPLNVRELDFLAQRLAVLHKEEPELRSSHLPDRIRFAVGGAREDDPAASSGAGAPPPTRADLLAELARAGGNLARASERLGISRQKAYRLLGDGSPERSKTYRRSSDPARE